MFRGLSLAFGTRRGRMLITRNLLAAFGLMAGVVQLVAALWPKAHLSPRLVLLGLGAVALAYALYRAWPRRSVSRHFRLPEVTVRVTVGDLFAQDAHLVIGFNDMFDTDTTDGVVISKTSVQGQFLERIYGGDRHRLDEDLVAALDDVPVIATEQRSDKRLGKLDRYAMGTVATVGPPDRRYFCVAYSRMENQLTVKSSVDYLWSALSSVWQAAYLYGQRGTVAIPVVGSELARINCLDRESLLKMVLLSFMARAREDLACKELVVVVHEKDYEHINMLEVAAFLRTL